MAGGQRLSTEMLKSSFDVFQILSKLHTLLGFFAMLSYRRSVFVFDYGGTLSTG